MEVHKQEFRVRDLPTQSVTLFPTQAQIVRDIKDVALKPGTNQIVVVGFSPTVDENSIKVEGTGAAIISDIAVELLPNREIFQDFYPSDKENDSETDDDDDAESDVDEPAELKAVRNKIQLVYDDVERASEAISSAESRLKFLDAYGKMLDRKRNVDIDAGVEVYRAERDKVFEDHMQGKVWQRELDEKLKALNKEQDRELAKYNKILKAQERKRKRVDKDKRLEREKKDRRKAEETREKLRIRAERRKYWPRKCYTVRITLDAPSFFTPSSSRRSSVSSATEFAKPVLSPSDDAATSAAVEAGPATCDLSISYVTSSAFWAPTYDLQLSTIKNTASLCFDAQLTNTTSESWTNCKIVLSTSQTTFSGLNDTIPILVPWRVKLGRGYGYDAILNSREEVEQKNKWKTEQKAHLNKLPARDTLFGVANDFSGIQPHLHHQMAVQKKAKSGAIRGSALFGASSNNINTNSAAPGWGAPPQQQQQQMQMYQMQQAPMARAAFGSAMPPLASAPPPPPVPAPMPDALLSRLRAVPRAAAAFNPSGSDDDDDDDVDGRTMLPEAAPELGFQESSFEETGMTTTYDLPGLKTLVPSSTASKQRVARISFTAVAFSHTVVAKYKPVAYLKAKLRNASKLTLLKGPAGLTLDGSFMGRTTLPLCSAGDTFSLNLGVDPAIRVAYPKPDVKRATTGIFTKEDSNAYKRSVTISNTRATAGKSIILMVLDQVPVSEDEKLRVDLQQPRGLTLTGGAVATGVGMAAPGKGPAAAKDWGTATAVLKKAGEIVWDVSLNAGKTVKLDLEYDVSAPTGEGVVQC